jgi:hypothetical protein
MKSTIKEGVDNISNINKINVNKIAEYCAKQAVILQEKAVDKVKDIDSEDLSNSAVLFFATEGARLERLSLETLSQISEHATKYQAEYICQQQEVVNKLKKVDVESLCPIDVIKYYLEAASVESACRGLPEFIVQYSASNSLQNQKD